MYVYNKYNNYVDLLSRPSKYMYCKWPDLMFSVT